MSGVSSYYCLLCSSPDVVLSSTSLNPLEKQDIDPPPSQNNATTTSTSLVDENAKVIFLLCKLLHLPKSPECEQLLQQHGHPATWIQLCAPCTAMAQQGRDLYLEMGRLQVEFQRLQNTLRNQLLVKREILENCNAFLDGGGYHRPEEEGFGGTTASDKIRAYLLGSTSSISVSNHFIIADDTVNEEMLDPVNVPKKKKKPKKRGTGKRLTRPPKGKRHEGRPKPINLIPVMKAEEQEGDKNNVVNRVKVNKGKVSRVNVEGQRRGRRTRKEEETKISNQEEQLFDPIKLEPEEMDDDPLVCTDALDILQLEMDGEGLVDAMMGEEILPESIFLSEPSLITQQVEQVISCLSPLPPKEQEESDSEDHVFGSNSSDSEYCVSNDAISSDSSASAEDDNNFKNKKRNKRNKLPEDEDSDNDDGKPKSKRAQSHPKKVRRPYKKWSKEEKAEAIAAKEESKKMKAIYAEKVRLNNIRQMEDKDYAYKVPVQPSWKWTHFFEWRKELLLSLRRPYLYTKPRMRVPKEVEEQITNVPTLQWLAIKFKVKEFDCPRCQTVFPTFIDFKRHGPSRCSSPYKCWFENCKHSFAVPYALESHVREKHAPDKDFICRGCGKFYLKLGDFNAHINKLSSPAAEGEEEQEKEVNVICKERAISCEKCLEMGITNYFCTQSLLDLHIRVKHLSNEEMPYVCTVSGCGRRFSLASVFKRHVQVIHSYKKEMGRNFICDQCGASFRVRQNLTSHIQKVHTCRQPGAKRFICDICGKGMVDACKLRRHKQIHIRPEDASHICELCGKRFRLREYLTIHMRSHDPERRLKYSHYQPKKKRAPGEPEKRGVSGAKIGRPPVDRSGERGESSTNPSKRRKEAVSKRNKKQQDQELSSDEEESSNSMEYTPNNSSTSFNSSGNQAQSVVSLSTPHFTFNNQIPPQFIGQNQPQFGMGLQFPYSAFPPRF